MTQKINRNNIYKKLTGKNFSRNNVLYSREN